MKGKKIEYPAIKSGHWITPRMSGYKLECCDCGLIHSVDFAVIDSEDNSLLNNCEVVFRVYRVEK